MIAEYKPPPPSLQTLLSSHPPQTHHLTVMQQEESTESVDVFGILKAIHFFIIQTFQITFLIFWFIIVTPVILLNYSLYYIDMSTWNTLLFPVLFVAYPWLALEFWADPLFTHDFSTEYSFIYANMTRWARTTALPIIVYLNWNGIPFNLG